MTAPPDFDPDRLEGYLKARLPELDGSMSVARIGGTVYDGSVTRQLQRIKATLTNTRGR